MKKFTSFILMTTLAFSLCACGNANTDTTSSTDLSEATTTEAASSDTIESADSDTDNSGNSNTTEAVSDESDRTTGESPAAMLFNDFKALIADGQLKTTDELANALISKEYIPFMGATMPVEEGYLNGFSTEISGFSSGTTFGPSIGSIPFVGYVFIVDDDVNTFMDTLKSAADLRWNICTQADEMLCDSVDNYVFFVMSPATFEE